jgi:ADP-ribosyl-[dinitrogen reductase] hydrolase
MLATLHYEEVRDRARGAFLGLAVGDSLGAPVEFMTRGEISAKYGVLREMVGGGWLRLRPGQVTDDTEMALCIARAIVSHQRWDLGAIAENFARWLRSRPVDVGDTCRRGIRDFMLKGQTETPYNQSDAGNGAVMRLLPVALFTAGDDDLLARYAIAQARLTHNHPLSDAACVWLGRLIQMSFSCYSKSRLRRELEPLLAEHPQFRFDPYPGLATGYVVDTMQTVFHHFFRGKDFETCLVGAVNQGGDADTTGAIVGALAGAYYGEEGIPRRWLKKMNRHLVNEITRLAEELLALSPYGRQMREKG